MYKSNINLQPTSPSSHGFGSVQQSEKANANYACAKNVPKEIADICFSVMKGFEQRFPSKFNHIHVETFFRNENTDCNGQTILRENGATVQLAIEKNKNYKNEIQALTEIALIFFHEVALHALPDLIALSKNAAPDSEENQHRLMFTPPNETNPFHKDLKMVLPHLPPNQQKYFLESYEKNVNDHIEFQLEKLCEEIDTDQEFQKINIQFKPTETWGKTLKENSNTPLSHFWRS